MSSILKRLDTEQFSKAKEEAEEAKRVLEQLKSKKDKNIFLKYSAEEAEQKIKIFEKKDEEKKTIMNIF